MRTKYLYSSPIKLSGLKPEQASKSTLERQTKINFVLDKTRQRRTCESGPKINLIEAGFVVLS